MKTLFRECFLVNWAIDPPALRSLLPPPLEPDLHGGRAYLSVVIAHLERMRPAFLPHFLGTTYNQVVYRAIVRCRGERGVYFVRSDADHPLMCLAGNWLTFFRFHLSRVRLKSTNEQVTFDLWAGPSERADIRATYDLASARRVLPPTSHFATLDDAQQFLVELYQAFGVEPASGRVDRVRIRRDAWNIQVVDDLRGEYPFMQHHAPFTPQNAQLDSIFYVRDLPYYWYPLEPGPGEAPSKGSWGHLSRASGLAAAAVTASVMAAGRAENGTAWPAINAVAHMVRGDAALEVDRFQPAVSLPALALNAASVSTWMLLYRLAFGRTRWPRSLLTGLLGALVAYTVDYRLVPKRLTPGFEKYLSSRGVALIYAVLGLCFALGGPEAKQQ